MKPMTTKAASRKAVTLARRLQAVFEETVTLRHELRESGFVPQNSEQELAMGALVLAFEAVITARSRLENAAKYLADSRTEAEVQAYYDAARKEEEEENARRFLDGPRQERPELFPGRGNFTITTGNPCGYNN